MNPESDAAARFLDNRACRLLLALPASLALWAALLAGLEHAMRPPSDAPAPQPLAMQFVEIERPPAADKPAAAFMPQPRTEPAPAPASAPPPLTPLPAQAPSRPADDSPAPRDAESRLPKPAAHHPPRPAQVRPAAPTSQPAPPPAPAPALASSAPAAPPGNQGIAQDSPARPLAQPLPALPDDLRDRNLQAVALARFLIRADGSAEITLIKPTPNPRLNQLLLESLRQWRFAPAMKDGKAAASTQDIRVHFKVD